MSSGCRAWISRARAKSRANLQARSGSPSGAAGRFVHGNIVGAGPIEHEAPQGLVAIGIPRVEDAEAVRGVFEMAEGAASFDGAPELVCGGACGERVDEALHVAVFVEVESGGQLDASTGFAEEKPGGRQLVFMPIG